jgi:hypothetical protein
MAQELPEESGCVLPLGPHSLIYLRSQHGGYLQARNLDEVGSMTKLKCTVDRVKVFV